MAFWQSDKILSFRPKLQQKGRVTARMPAAAHQNVAVMVVLERGRVGEAPVDVQKKKNEGLGKRKSAASQGEGCDMGRERRLTNSVVFSFFKTELLRFVAAAAAAA